MSTLARFSAGRILLHLLAIAGDEECRFHFAGILGKLPSVDALLALLMRARIRFVDALVAYLAQPVKKSVPVLTDGRSMRAGLSRGDVLLSRGNTPLAALIRRITQSQWTHVSIYVGPLDDGPDPVCIVEADIAAGVRSIRFSELNALELRVLRPVRLSEAARGQLADWVVSRIGAGYDLSHAWSLGRKLLTSGCRFLLGWAGGLILVLLLHGCPQKWVQRSIRRYHDTLVQWFRLRNSVVIATTNSLGYGCNERMRQEKMETRLERQSSSVTPSLCAGGIRGLGSHACAFVAGVALTLIAVAATMTVNTQRFSFPALVPATKFDGALRAAMIQMGAGMCIAPSGDPDRDFARAMIPHHQGAVEMARLELLFGGDARLRRLAQGIIVEQSQEIALLRNILDGGAAASETRLNP
jgi:hypothetical protein